MQTLIDISNRRAQDRRGPIHKEPAQLLTRRYIVARLYVTISILLTILTMLLEPFSTHGQAAIITHAPVFWLYSSAFVCVIGIFDILINDFGPDKYKFEFAYTYRHLIYMCMSLVSFSISMSIMYSFGSSLIIGRLWLDGGIAAFVAILDIFARHKGTP